MTIGEALKHYRLRQGKTQKEMAGDLMTESFYSKVERGVHKINSDLLIKLLIANGLSPDRFFEIIVGDADPRFKLKITNDDLWKYTNNRQLDKLKEAKKKIENSDDASSLQKLQVNLCVAAAERSDKNVSPKIQKRIKYILIHDNWDTYSYDFLSLAMYALKLEDAYNMLKLAIQSFNKKTEYDPLQQICIALAAVNFLNCCYDKHGKKEYAEEAIEFIYSLSFDVMVIFAKVFATFYKAVYDEDDAGVENCMQVLKKSGCYPAIGEVYEDYMAKHKKE